MFNRLTNTLLGLPDVNDYLVVKFEIYYRKISVIYVSCDFVNKIKIGSYGSAKRILSINITLNYNCSVGD